MKNKQNTLSKKLIDVVTILAGLAGIVQAIIGIGSLLG
jgi:hypothetical protein